MCSTCLPSWQLARHLIHHRRKVYQINQKSVQGKQQIDKPNTIDTIGELGNEEEQTSSSNQSGTFDREAIDRGLRYRV